MNSLRKHQKAASANAEAVKAEQAQMAEYYITDPDARNFGNIRVKPGQKTVTMTAAQAAFFLGTGLSATPPEDAGEKTTKAGHTDEDAKRQAEADAAAEAKAKEAREAAEAAERASKPASGSEAPKAADAPATGETGATGGDKATTATTKPATRPR